MSETVEIESGPPQRDTPLKQRLGLLADILFYVAATAFFVYLSRYYMTGVGGPSLLAVTMVPMTLCIVVLNDLRGQRFYERLGVIVPWFIAAAYIGFSLYAAYYLLREFDAIRMTRMGIWNTHDLIVGAGMAALILEYTRRRYFVLFVINLLLILYTVYGYMVPGMFNHPGMSWRRVASSVSVEMSTGIFERMPQLGLTLIGSFILVLAALRAFGCIDSILQGSSRLAMRSPTFLPQAAVIGSFGVAAVSGSGAANAATTGSATIPALIKAGFPRVTAAAVETASSLGGQLMPPLMGIAAFLMAEYLRVSYFEVVARGFVPAFIYFFGVAFAVYLLALRHHQRAVVLNVPPLGVMDRINIGAYFLSVVALIWLMGFERRPAMTSAQTVFVWLLVALSIAYLWRLWRRRTFSIREVAKPYMRLVESFATITSELVILLATLGILTASFTITGVPTKVGVILMEGAAINLVLMVLVAFGFGYLVGMGLPVAPTYIITAVVIAPFMIRAGFDPWVVHFFAFFVAVFGELSPPTSVVAAVTSRIADAPFIATMMHALLICMPLMVMMGAVFIRPDLVVEPGWAQMPAFALVLVGTLALSFAAQGKFSSSRKVDYPARWGLALLAALLLLYPGNDVVAVGLAMLLLGIMGFGLMRMRGRYGEERAAARAASSG
ncbi:MAG: TRAP transporter permease [Rhizobiaceae bacterium]